HGSVPFHDDEDDSPVEEVSPVKLKKPSRRAAKAKKDETKEVKEPPKEWTVDEEIALCQAVIRYFEKETGSTRGYDSIVSKWKNKVRPKIGAFCAIIKNIKANHESGTNDLDVYQKACAKFKMIYKGDFNLEHCYNILKDHSASGGINLNEEADEAVQETQEFDQWVVTEQRPRRKQPLFNEDNSREMEKENVLDGIWKNKVFVSVIAATVIFQHADCCVPEKDPCLRLHEASQLLEDPIFWRVRKIHSFFHGFGTQANCLVLIAYLFKYNIGQKKNLCLCFHGEDLRFGKECDEIDKRMKMRDFSNKLYVK
ncbi:hypothetical protein Tco_0541000, partial [Tanacetum coccineum]